MMYDELRRLQSEEKKSNKLAPVEEELYAKTFNYLERLKSELASKWDTKKARELENCEKVLDDIERRRMEKILLYTFNEVYNGFDPAQKLSNEEERLYKKVRVVVKEFKERFEKRDACKKSKREEEGIIKVKVLKDVPKFKAVDGSEYGPFSAGIVCRLPKQEGNIMIKRNIAVPL